MMECPPESKDVDETKHTSPVKKSNGLDCNGVANHPSDCDSNYEVSSLSNSSSEPAPVKQQQVNGFADTPGKESSAAERAGASPRCGVLESSDEKNAAAAERDRDAPNPEPVNQEGDQVPVDNSQQDTTEPNTGEKDDSVFKGDTQMNGKETMIEAKEVDSISSAKESRDNANVSANGESTEPVKESVSDSSKSIDQMSEEQKSALDKTSDLQGAVEKKSQETDMEITEVSDISRESGDGGKEAGVQSENQKKPPKVNEAKPVERSQSTGDDIEIIGESFTQNRQAQNVVYVGPSLPKQPLSTLPFQSGMASTNSASLLNSANMHNTLLLQNMTLPGNQTSLLTTAGQGSGNLMYPEGFRGAQGVSLLNTSASAPPAPKSSMDQIELIRWEIQNRINVRPKYFKPNPTAELGPLGKFLFDIGSDLIKETVYHDLVKIQSKKNDDDKLSDKERDDLAKLKEIEKDLQATIGHLKLRLRKRCQGCGFQTESNNVLFFHKQFPHEDNKNLRCGHCQYSTKQSMAFKFHMEAEHAMQGRLHDKKAFYECHMCPYENNQEQKLASHRERCLKQFRPLFNLHPSCLSGAEINLCLENIFYKPVVPKNLKLLQQKHAQQQAALAEAKRQHAQMQMIAAQKNAAALAAKKQREQQLQREQAMALQKRQQQLQNIAPRFNSSGVSPRMPVVPRAGVSSLQQPARYNSKAMRPTVANMLNKANNNVGGAMPAQNSVPGGFEVCEICGGYVKDRKALRIHFFYAHRIDLPFNLFERNQAPLYCATCYVRFWTAQGLRKHIDTHKEENQTRGVVGKCISCGHQVLNLLLHMRIVHNRELQHYINALMCMFCGGHFSSRQDCERHIVKTHGNVDPVSGTLKSPPMSAQATPPQGAAPANAKSSPAQKRSGKGGNNNLVKGSVCVLCNLNFGRNVDLTRHCMRMHHTCMKCGMVVIDKASLLKHTCLSSPSGTQDCGMCGETGFHPAYYVKHLRDKHLRKFHIKVAKVSGSVIERWTKRPCPFDESVVEISDSDDDASLPPRQQTRKSPIKKPKIGPACSKVRKPAPPAKKARIGPASKIGRRPVATPAEAVSNHEAGSGTETSAAGAQEKREKPGESVAEKGSSLDEVGEPAGATSEAKNQPDISEDQDSAAGDEKGESEESDRREGRSRRAEKRKPSSQSPQGNEKRRKSEPESA